jgi:NAD-specific glutamate dehydrogenase
LIVSFGDLVGYGSGGWLIDDPKDIETCDGACVLHRLALGIIEVFVISESWQRKFIS